MAATLKTVSNSKRHQDINVKTVSFGCFFTEQSHVETFGLTLLGTPTAL